MIFPPTEVAKTGRPKASNFLDIGLIFLTLYEKRLKVLRMNGKKSKAKTRQTDAYAITGTNTLVVYWKRTKTVISTKPTLKNSVTPRRNIF